jgi:glycosyltransferase involved in cell wall biosynthesis
VRILHVIPSLAPRFGGPSKVAIEMCRELARRGEATAIYTTNFDGPLTLNVPLSRPVADAGGVEITYFPVFPHNYYTPSLPLAAALKRDIWRYDIVHIHSLYRFSTAAAAHYSRVCGVPYVIRPHGTLDPFMFQHHRLRKWLYEALFDRHYLEQAAAVHFTSEEEMELARATGIAFRGVVVPLGVTDDRVNREEAASEFHSKWPETCGRRVILFLGRLNFKKGLDLLARAFGALSRRRRDAHLFIAGPDDEGYGVQMRHWLKDEGALEQTTFSGMLLGRDKTAALAGSDVFVLPSYSENFGVAVVEALASGLPVVISNRVNIWREIVRSNAGVVIDCDAAELEQALVRVLDEPALRQRMTEAARRLACEHFNWRAAGDRMLELYRDILQRSPNHGGS